MLLSRKKQNKGFTLIEIVTVVIIVGVLAMVAIPRFTGVFERVRVSEGVQMLSALLSAQKAYELENDAYATDPDDLDIEINRAANFDETSIVVQDDVNNVAQIDRAGGDYTLSIDENGAISCTNGGAPITFTCAQAGY